MVTFRFYAAARAAAGTPEIALPAGPVRELVGQLTAGQAPRLGEVLAMSSLVCRGVRLDPASEDLLPDGAVVEVLPPFAGG